MEAAACSRRKCRRNSLNGRLVSPSISRPTPAQPFAAIPAGLVLAVSFSRQVRIVRDIWENCTIPTPRISTILHPNSKIFKFQHACGQSVTITCNYPISRSCMHSYYSIRFNQSRTGSSWRGTSKCGRNEAILPPPLSHIHPQSKHASTTKDRRRPANNRRVSLAAGHADMAFQGGG